MERDLQVFARMEYGLSIYQPKQYLVIGNLERYKPLDKIEERFKIFPKYLEYRIDEFIQIANNCSTISIETDKLPQLQVQQILYYFEAQGFLYLNPDQYKILTFDEWLKENKLYDFI